MYVHNAYKVTKDNIGKEKDQKPYTLAGSKHRRSADREVFNNMSLPPGVKFGHRDEVGPRGELCPLGDMFTQSFTYLFSPRGEENSTI
jgi:hypothetical protein